MAALFFIGELLLRSGTRLRFHDRAARSPGTADRVETSRQIQFEVIRKIMNVTDRQPRALFGDVD